MNRSQHAHKLSTNERIVMTLKENHDKWLSSNEIARMIGMGNPRGIGRRLNYLSYEIRGLEKYLDEGTHKRYFRYRSGGIGNEENAE